jgi:hypothetical protein
MRRFFVLLFILLIAAPVTFAQTTIKTVVVSAEFANIPGTPRIVRNGFKHLWVAAWRQGTPGKILGRIIDAVRVRHFLRFDSLHVSACL